MDDKKMREIANDLIKTRGQAAKEAGVDYVYFTRWLNGGKVGQATKDKIKKWIYVNTGM